MNNLKYFPFERNRYFYGKLLSVDDFEAEQRYMNDKRRLVNRFLHGTGVVCGLQVVEVDDMTISVEMGMALDFSGREIVVPQPVTKKLSSIEGFSEYAELEEEQGILYLGISYHETKIEPVHNIVRTDSMQEEEFNKYAEGYRLFVTGEEPEREGSWITELYEQTKTVYQGNGIRIRQTVPRYIQSGEESEFTVMVEKSGQKKLISFSYQIRLSGREAEGNSLLEVSFDEHSFTPSDRYVFTKRVRARAVEDVRGCMEPVPDSFVLTVGQETKKDRIGGSFQVNISGGDPRRTMVQEYYHTAMEDVLRGNYKQPVYLARLEVIQAGDTYVIEKVENVPSQQYVWNNMLTAAMETMRMRLPAEGRGQFVLPRGQEEACEIDKKESAQIRTGDVWIRLGLGGVVGQCYYSDEIVHGLGHGEILIWLGLSKGERV